MLFPPSKVHPFTLDFVSLCLHPVLAKAVAEGAALGARDQATAATGSSPGTVATPFACPAATRGLGPIMDWE